MVRSSTAYASTIRSRSYSITLGIALTTVRLWSTKPGRVGRNSIIHCREAIRSTNPAPHVDHNETTPACRTASQTADQGQKWWNFKWRDLFTRATYVDNALPGVYIAID